MGINSRDRYENHMDVSSPETLGDAEKVSGFEEIKDPYDDLFDKKLDEFSISDPNGYRELSFSRLGKDNVKKAMDSEKEYVIDAHMTQENSDKEPFFADDEKFYNSELVFSPESEEFFNEFDTCTAIDNKVIELPKQQLPKAIQDTFRGGNYRTVEAAEDMILYRVYGEGAGRQGCFLTTQVPTDRMNTKLESALPTKVEGNMTKNGFEETARWNNSREYYCEVHIPKGTVLNIGKVGEQFTMDNHILKGGADQILVSPRFASEPSHYKKEQRLGYAGNYNVFSEKAKRLES